MVEVPGTAADASTLPNTHIFEGTFGIPRLLGTSCEGATVLRIRRGDIRYGNILCLTSAAQRGVLQKCRVGHRPHPQQLAGVCPCIFQNLRQGREQEAELLAKGVPGPAERAAAEGINSDKPWKFLQDALDHAATLELTALDQSGVPDLFKEQ